MSDKNDAPRDKQFLLARHEARVLEWIARRLPRWVTPDHLTGLGVLAAVGIAAAYLLSNGDTIWLWAASGLLVVHWLGDSLDGTLARVRKIERPTYGYYLDHLVDALATAVIGLGLGLSPYMLLVGGPGDRDRATWCCRSTPTSRPTPSGSSRSATAASGPPRPAWG